MLARKKQPLGLLQSDFRAALFETALGSEHAKQVEDSLMGCFSVQSDGGKKRQLMVRVIFLTGPARIGCFILKMSKTDNKLLKISL